jgi:hypothetical protein
VGASTVVSPSGVSLGPVPAFPLLAALPADGAAPGPSLVALGIPLVAGVLVGVVLLRRTWFLSPESAALCAAGAGVLAGLVAGVLALLSGGGIGGGRLVTLGPIAWQVAGVAGVELGLVAAATAWLLGQRVNRRGSR